MGKAEAARCYPGNAGSSRARVLVPIARGKTVSRFPRRQADARPPEPRVGLDRVSRDNLESNNREPLAAGDRTGTELAGLRREVELLREQLDNRDESIRDLRSRLDAESAERRTAQAQLTALLTDQRATTPAPRRSWWPWQRRR